MSESRITESRRRFVEYMGEHPEATFSELRDALILRRQKRKLIQGGMNLATLYRIIDAFKERGLIHEVEVRGERMILLCQDMDHAHKKGMILEVCLHCHTITDTHFVVQPPVVQSETVQYVGSCGSCQR